MKTCGSTISATFLVIMVAGCSNHVRMETWDDQVLSVVLTEMCSHKATEYSFVSASTSLAFGSMVPQNIEATARASLLARNESASGLRVFPPCNTLRILKRSESDEYFGTHREIHEQWMAFYARFPDASGIMTLSLPGYSADGCSAVVQVAGTCGATCGGGAYWILHRIDGRWRLKPGDVIQGWIS
jgi:hypothetical protein